MSMEEMAGSLGALEALRWFLVPATLQWFILLETKTSRRWLRWSMLLALLAPLQIIFAEVLLVMGGGLLITFLLQLDIWSFLSGSASLLGMTFGFQWRLFARFGLLLAGWGSAWALYYYKNKEVRHETRNPSL